MARLIQTVFALLLLLPTSAAAGGLDSAIAAFDRGAFVAAAEAGQAGGESAGLTLAARALIAEAIIGPESQTSASLRQAVACARAAVAVDSRNVEARLQWAIALGMQGRRMSIAEAAGKGYARKGRKLIDEALALDPNEPWAHALTGAWHLEVLRRGGALGATLYGAHLSDGLAAFERARKLAPEDGAIAYQITVSLLDYDAVRFADRAEVLLGEVDRWRPSNAFETRIKAQAAEVRAALTAQGPEAAARLAVRRFS